MLHIEHYSKTYPGGKKAVDDLTLHVGPGEIYGFIGHNGAGKTTTLRAVAGVMDFTEGTITPATILRRLLCRRNVSPLFCRTTRTSMSL